MLMVPKIAIVTYSPTPNHYQMMLKPNQKEQFSNNNPNLTNALHMLELNYSKRLWNSLNLHSLELGDGVEQWYAQYHLPIPKQSC